MIKIHNLFSGHQTKLKMACVSIRNVAPYLSSICQMGADEGFGMVFSFRHQYYLCRYFISTLHFLTVSYPWLECRIILCLGLYN